MRKVKSKKLRKLANQLYDPGIPEHTRKKIYRQLKNLYRDDYLPKDLKIGGTD